MQFSTRNVAVVGVGNVGVAGAYAMYLTDVCEQLLLVDMNRARAEGEALDLMHGQGLTGRVQIRAVDYDALGNCQVVVVAAGINQKPGQSRLELLEDNARVFRSIAEQLDRHAPEAIVVVASNPVDRLIESRSLRRVWAQRGVTFSNSLIEARWRTLKHQWLFFNTLDSRASVTRLVAFYVEAHNGEIPHTAFRGQSPDKMYNGRDKEIPDQLRVREEAGPGREAGGQQGGCIWCMSIAVAIDPVELRDGLKIIPWVAILSGYPVLNLVEVKRRPMSTSLGFNT